MLDLTIEINEMINERKMDDEKVQALIRDMLKSAYKRKTGTDENIVIKFIYEDGRKCVEVFAQKEVVEEETLVIEEDVKMETVIRVDGMMCKHCKAHVEKACKGVEGTVDAVVDLEKKIVTVTGTASVEALKAAILDAGYEMGE